VAAPRGRRVIADVGFDVFDVHHHVGRAFDALGGELDDAAGDAGDLARVELAERLRIMDEGGVKQALVIPGHGYLRPNGHADTRHVNDEIAAYRDATPDRFPVACGIVEPRDGPHAMGEIERVESELGLVAISFHTRFQGVSMDSRWILRYLDRMGELGLVPIIHAMDDTPEESLWKLASIARSFPDLTILALDAFSSYEATRQCFFVADVAPNIVFDTSLSYNFDFIEEFAGRFGHERVLFGTDLYSWPVGRRVSHLLPQIVESGLSNGAKAAILGGNARGLFGLG
jgi:predicted TIM-barrel fold metal-dependent hydrolase